LKRVFEKWRAQGDDFRTFLGELVSASLQIKTPCRDTLGIAILTEWSYHEVIMKGITVKLPDTTLRQLRQEARATGRSVAALIRERLEVAPRRRARRSVYEITSDLAGSLAGDRTPATNDRRKFARS
jgi:hypothetical protein